MHNQIAATHDQQPREKPTPGKAPKVSQCTKDLRLPSQAQFCHKQEATTFMPVA